MSKITFPSFEEIEKAKRDQLWFWSFALPWNDDKESLEYKKHYKICCCQTKLDRPTAEEFRAIENYK